MQDEILSFLYPESYEDETSDNYRENSCDDIQDALDCADYNENF